MVCVFVCVDRESNVKVLVLSFHHGGRSSHSYTQIKKMLKENNQLPFERTTEEAMACGRKPCFSYSVTESHVSSGLQSSEQKGLTEHR